VEAQRSSQITVGHRTLHCLNACFFHCRQGICCLIHASDSTSLSRAYSVIQNVELNGNRKYSQKISCKMLRCLPQPHGISRILKGYVTVSRTCRGGPAVTGPPLLRPPFPTKAWGCRTALVCWVGFFERRSTGPFTGIGSYCTMYVEKTTIQGQIKKSET
jgi:hypothetical protein